MKAFELPNYRQIKVKYIPPTNHNGGRICIYEPKRYNDDTVQRKYFPYCYETGDVMEQAYEILIRNGWIIVCRACEQENYIFMALNWGDDFKQVKELT